MRLGELLLNAGAITPENLDIALLEQKKSHMRLGEVLIKNGYLSELHLAEALSEQLELPYISLLKVVPEQEALNLIPENIAIRLKLIPLELIGDNLIRIAMSDPMDSLAIDEIRVLTRKEVTICVATFHDVNQAISTYYRVHSSLKDAMADISKHEKLGIDINKIQAETSSDITINKVDDAPVIRLVNNILEQAVKEKASDVHIEPFEHTVRVRFRVDGTLFSNIDIPKDLLLPFVARIKILSGMDIAEKRRPQDGRILIKVKDKRIDLRVSSIPSIYGEKIVLRLLDQSNEKITIENLGFTPSDITTIKDIISASHGMFLVTGPTGSGKSTTLYSLLDIINKPEFNIITLEDPVEYTLDGITQIQINEKIGVTFGSTLRAILRQDPDKLMVGEIRDTETAHLAVRIALTGHFLLSTLHTNDAPSAISRLIDMDVPRFLIASSLRGVMAQRLLRKLCPVCKKEYLSTEIMSEQLDIPLNTKLYKPCGCPTCRFTGYSGRVLVSEVMKIDSEIRDMINNGEPEYKIREYLKDRQVLSLRDSALKKVIDGLTSIDEMLTTTMDL